MFDVPIDLCWLLLGLEISHERNASDVSTYFDGKKMLRSGNEPLEELKGSSSGNEPGWVNESSTSSMLFSDGDIASITSSGGICHGRCLLRSADAIEHSSSIGFAERLSLSKQERTVSWLCVRSQSMLCRTTSWEV